MPSDEIPEGLLPVLQANKKYREKQKFLSKKIAKEKERESCRHKASKKTVTSVRRSTKKQSKKSVAEVTSRSKGKDTTVKKVRRPKTVVSNAQTGKETLLKKKASKILKQSREKVKGSSRNRPATSSQATVPRKKEGVVPVTQEAIDRELLNRAIRGTEDDAPAAVSSSLDAFLYPDLAFFADYSEKRQAAAMSEEELLQQAHCYFSSLGKKEQQFNRAAANHLRALKSINRRGGDKDGFRYVVPKNVKQVVRQMIETHNPNHATIDPDTLLSNFGGDDAEATSDKPMRRQRKRSTTFSDFYQFQVSKRWTRNAESFLNRGRVNKSLFEAKKHQRSIKKL